MLIIKQVFIIFAVSFAASPEIEGGILEIMVILFFSQIIYNTDNEQYSITENSS